jgi:hypothetical protein
MADHVRKQLRDAIATTLTGLPTTGAHVFKSRVYPLQDADLPGIVIRNRYETSTPLTIDEPRTLDRVVQFDIVAVAKMDANLDDMLDTMCKEIEAALTMPLAAISALARTIALQSTSFDLQGTAEKKAGMATLLYEVNYFTKENAPDVAH